MTTGTVTVARPAASTVGARDTRVLRWTGLYFAASAGAIQLLDIFADRLQLPEQFFVYVVILAVVGLPITAAGAFIRSISVRERAGSRSGGRPDGGRRDSGRAGPSVAREQTRELHSNTHDRTDVAADSDVGGSITNTAAKTFEGRIAAELELAASHLRLARMRASDGDAAGADEHYEAFFQQVGVATDAIDSLIAEVHAERSGGESPA